MRIYLSGAIEYAPGHGKAWRAALTPFLRELGHAVYDPAEDERKNLTDEEMREFRGWKHSDLPRFQQVIRKIIAYDLDWIEQRADCVVAYWDEHAANSAGSHAELSAAHRRGIPVLLVTAVPRTNVSGWVLGCASEVFDSFEPLKQHLREGAAGKHRAVRSPERHQQGHVASNEVAMNWTKGNLGWIEVICGPMFSGKSEELIRRLRRAEIARQRVQIFKPGIDRRYSHDHIVSHSDLKIHSVCVGNADDIQSKLDLRTEVIGIDEAQFLGDELVDYVVRLADMGKRIIIAGLDTDYLGRPFHPIPELLAVADDITKTLAICMQCGNPAKHTQRLVANEDLIVVGAAGMYEARCRRCFEPNLAKVEESEPAARATAK